MVHMGVMCERCRTVYFIGTAPGIKPMQSRGMYSLVCRFCTETREFRKDTIRPYRVSEDVFTSGSAKEGEYELVGVPNQPHS